MLDDCAHLDSFGDLGHWDLTSTTNFFPNFSFDPATLAADFPTSITTSTFPIDTPFSLSWPDASNSKPMHLSPPDFDLFPSNFSDAAANLNDQGFSLHFENTSASQSPPGLDHTTSPISTSLSSSTAPTPLPGLSLPSSSKPKRLGRPPASAKHRSESPPPDEDVLVKRQRNNVAAKKYRQKKVDRIQELEEELDEVKHERDSLRIELARQEAETKALREMLKMATSGVLRGS